MGSRFYSIFIGFLTMVLTTTEAQPQLTLQQLIPGGSEYKSYTPKSIDQYGFLGERPWWVQGDSLYSVGLGKKERSKVLLTRKRLNDLLQEAGLERAKSFPKVLEESSTDRLLCLMGEEWYVEYDIQQHEIKRFVSLKKEYKDRLVSPDRNSIAFTTNNNLYLAQGTRVVPITREVNKAIVSGQQVHRNEFGIDRGVFWSPSGDRVAYYRMDESMVSDYPGVDISARVAELQSFKYPMAGMKSHQVRLCVYDPEQDQSIYLRTRRPYDRYLTNVAWSPDERMILVAEVNRAQDSCSVVSYSPNDGKKIRTLFTETSDKWVEPELPPMFVSNDRFLWVSQRDGYAHIYLYTTEGRCVKQLTQGAWVVQSLKGLDEKKEHLFYESNESSPLEKRLYVLNIKSGERRCLTPEAGVHNSRFSRSGRHILDHYSSPTVPNRMLLTQVRSGESRTLHNARVPMSEYTFPEVEIGTIKAADGATDLYYRLVKPQGWKSGERYPVIIYVYGGPHAQLVNNSWQNGTRGWDYYMAQRGFVVFTLDNRGSANRGFAFESTVHRHLGKEESRDQMEGVKFLQSLPYVDGSRIGVHGWSFGGFMTTKLMLDHPQTFKVGVAGGAVIDWSLYEVMYGERYMGQPQNNAEGYAEANLCNYAGNLQGKLLLIHDDQDPVVVMQHSLRFLHASIKAGTYPDYFIYPGHLHNVIGPDRVHLYEKVTRYFEEHL